MSDNFEEFIKPLKETLFSLKNYVDFHKVAENVEAISMKLNQLNYLIGQEDMAAAVNRLWEENPKVFSVLDVLIAVRTKDRKKALDSSGNILFVSDCFKSPEQVTVFLNETGLTEVLQNRKIKNLVDYVFGVEVGLDTNARKNRSGHIMENFVAELFTQNGIAYEKEVDYTDFPEIVKVLGADKKRFDFVIKSHNVVYLIEANFYSGGGSKLNEVARSYSELSPKINSVPGYEFVWITDGTGWLSAKNKLQEAFSHIPNVYNLSTIQDFITKVKDY